MPNSKQTKQLLDEINYLRNELLRVGAKKGLTHYKTLRVSRALDKALNEYQTKTIV